ncbi:MAG: N-acetylmuramidase family protein [Salinisphaeraceae bacterium]
MLLFEGHHGPDVETLQRRLQRAGHDIQPDGVFGDNTDAAVRAFQHTHDLVSDGIVGPKTLAVLTGATPNAEPLHQTDLMAAAERLGAELAAVMAVNEVESRGEGFLPRGRPVILFERHIMYRRLEDHGADAGAAMARRPDLVNTRPGGYRGGGAEHMRLISAKSIHIAAALESASWGLFQIMGFHWERLGYDSAEDFAVRMGTSEANHLEAFVRFIEADEQLKAALQQHDWDAFAYSYNGPGYQRNDYDTRLAAAYRRHARALTEADPPPAKPRRRKRKAA